MKQKIYILLNELESKHSMGMKISQFMLYYIIKTLIKNTASHVAWKLVPRPFLF